MDLSSVRVPAGSILCMIITMLLCFLLPIVLCIIWHKKTKSKVYPVFIGAATFVVFALILEQILHTVVLKSTGTAITGNIWLYALYGGFAAGIFEETGRFIAMKFFMKKDLSKESSIMYGIGHGGIEAIIICGFSMISNIIISIMLNAGMGNLLLTGLTDDMKSTLYTQLAPIETLPSATFLLAGVERIGAVILHIMLSYIVYKAVAGKKIGYFILAILIHAFVDASTVLLAGNIPNILIEAVLYVYDAVLLIFIIKLYKSEKVVSSDNLQAIG